MPMSTGGADSSESAESADGGAEEEISIQQEDAVAGSRDEAHGKLPSASSGEVDVVEPTGDASDEGGDATAPAAAAVGATEGAAVRAEEKEEAVPGDAPKEEEEDDGETVYLPSGDNKDFRLFRAKLRAGSDEKWREQLKRNVNVAQLGGQDAWAHELNTPEKGCLIVAKSSAFSLTQTYFNEAVIFLASHDENGSAGFILNRPTSVCLGDLLEDDALPHFRGTPLYLGGDVGEGNVQILHPYGPDKLAGSMEIVPGVYISGAVDDADHMVADGRAKVDDFRFFLHLCGWAPGQLEAEIERGVWFPAATSTNVIMKHCLGLPVPMWREVMTLMGPKYGLLARDTYDDL